RRGARVFWGLLILGLLSAAVGVVVSRAQPESSPFFLTAALLIAGMVLVPLGLVFAPFYQGHAAQLDQHLGRTEGGQHLARWAYPESVWLAFVRREWGQARSDASVAALFLLAAGPVLGGASMLVHGAGLLTLAVCTAVGAGAAVLAFGILGLPDWL